MSQNPTPNQPTGVDQPVNQQAFDENGAPIQQPVTPQPGQPQTQLPPQAAPQQTAPQQSAAGQMAAPQTTPSGETVPVVGQNTTNPGQIKDPEEWTTGDQPMTDAQRSYLDSLAKQAGETLPANLTKAQASEHIDRLQQQSSAANQPPQGGTIGA